MSWVSGIIVFLLTWWTVLFTVLPWGVQSESEGESDPEPGRASGAPVAPRIRQKFLITTFISVLIWLIICILIELEIVDFREVARVMMEEDNLK